MGFAFDFMTNDEVGLRALLDSIDDVVGAKDAQPLLRAASDVIRGIRDDVDARKDLLELVALSLSRPDSPRMVPMLREMIQDGVIIEVLDAVVRLLEGCGRAS